MLKKVDFNMMKEFVEKHNPTFDPQYMQHLAKELTEVIDEALDEVIYTYCKEGRIKDFCHTNEGETFTLLEIKTMRQCSFYEAVILMDGFIKDAKSGRRSIMRR